MARRPDPTGSVELEGGRGRFAAVVARDRDSQEILRFPAAAVFVFIGLTPNNAFLGDAIERARAYQETGVDGLFFTGIKSRDEVEAISAATRLPIVATNRL